MQTFLRAQPEHESYGSTFGTPTTRSTVACGATTTAAAVPELAHLAPLFHALHAPMARLQLSTGRGLFDGVADRAGDSEEGVRQGGGSAESSVCAGRVRVGRFCVGIGQSAAPPAATSTTSTRVALLYTF